MLRARAPRAQRPDRVGEERAQQQACQPDQRGRIVGDAALELGRGTEHQRPGPAPGPQRARLVERASAEFLGAAARQRDRHAVEIVEQVLRVRGSVEDLEVELALGCVGDAGEHLVDHDRRIDQPEQRGLALLRRDRLRAVLVDRQDEQEAGPLARVLHQIDPGRQRGIAAAQRAFDRVAAHALRADVVAQRLLVDLERVDELDHVHDRVVAAGLHRELGRVVEALALLERLEVLAQYALHESESEHARVLALEFARGDVGVELEALDRLARVVDSACALERVDRQEDAPLGLECEPIGQAVELGARLGTIAVARGQHGQQRQAAAECQHGEAGDEDAAACGRALVLLRPCCARAARTPGEERTRQQHGQHGADQRARERGDARQEPRNGEVRRRLHEQHDDEHLRQQARNGEFASHRGAPGPLGTAEGRNASIGVATWKS